MLECLNSLRGIGMGSILVRMVLAVVCGGLVGMERELKRRPAGFRTHILICLGAATTTLTSQFLLAMGYYTDVARLGAQVIAGIGFIGAGTIIVTRSQRVKGLTTAAGLWVSAIVGLTIGAGYYEAAILTTILILLAEHFFAKLEFFAIAKARDIRIYLEFQGNDCLEQAIRLLRELKVKIIDLDITKSSHRGESSAILALQMSGNCSAETVCGRLLELENVEAVEEL